MPTRKLRFMPTKANFQLGDKLGAGTVGIVYRATSPDIPEPVAVKILHPAMSDDERIVNRFEREIMIMERLNHPHIVRHYGGGMMDGQYFYAMQLLDHGTLKEYLSRNGSIPWPQTAAFAVQICSALQHAHNHGIVHRDLKPSNLFFDGKGGIVLGDFGIARDNRTADITADGITVGTYSYMSPEQISADHRIDGKADLYSLGCVMFEMLTGHPPYQGENFAQVWEQHIHRPIPSVRDTGIDCPEWLDQLVQRLLAKKPQNRPFSARAVEGILLQNLTGEFGERSRELTKQLAERKYVPANSEPRLWVAWLALVVVVVLLTAVAIFGR